MQKELLQFKLQEVWTLVDFPNGKRAIGTKWVFKNKKNKRGIVIRNKARLVAQGYTQEEGIDYDEFFAPVARIEAIRLFLAYASFKDFVVYQIDVKSAFLYGKIEEEVYVCQPLGFEDPNFPDRVYKVEKSLYGLHQGPKAWHKGDILLVQVYVDDIIFGSTNKKLCIAFEKLIHEKFQMSSMGELIIFLGLQVESQDCKHTNGNSKALLKDEDGEEVDGFYCKKQTVVANSTTEVEYVAASSCYLLSKAFDRKAKKSVKLMMKKLFRMELELCCNQSNARHALTINPTIYISCIEQFWSTVKVKTINGEAQLHALVDGKKIIITESSVRRDLQLADEEGVDCLPNSTIFEQLTLMGPKTTAWNEFSSTMASAIICLATNQKFNFSKFIFESMIRNLDNLSGKFFMYPRKPKRKDTQVPQSSDPIENVADEAVHKELGDSLVRAATTASSLEVEQDSGNTNKTQSKATPNESSSIGTTSGGGPSYQETIGDTIAQTRFESVFKHSNDSLLARGFLILRDKGPLKIYEIVVLKRIESSDYEESLGEDASKQRELLPLIQIDINYPEVVDAAQVSTAATTVTITTEEITLAQALEALKTSKPKVKGIVFQEPGKSTTITISSQKSQDKGKGILVEPVKPMKKKDQIMFDEETAKMLQAEFDEEERFAREKTKKEQEANIALLKDLKYKEFDTIQKMFDRAFQRVNTFEDFRTEFVEGKDKRAGAELIQENEEEVAVDAIPLAVKSPRIVDWKIHKEGKKSYYQIVRAYGKSQMYMIFSQMLKSFNSEDLEDLYKLVKARYGSIRPVESMDYLLWSDMKIMFEPHIEDEVWKLQQGYKVLEWKLYDSCGVHSLMMQSMQIYMLVDKKYPLTPPTLSTMLEKKLQIDYESKMAYQLCKLIMKQLKNAAYELQRKYAKWLMLLVPKLMLLVKVNAASTKTA
ncbi:retrovirus-related pol polyprotein from transposon TNT 1-94 [Tanacetum coccineum]